MLKYAVNSSSGAGNSSVAFKYQRAIHMKIAVFRLNREAAIPFLNKYPINKLIFVYNLMNILFY